MPKMRPPAHLPPLHSPAFARYVDRALDGPLKPCLSDGTLDTATGLRSKLTALFAELLDTEFPESFSLALARLRDLRGFTQSQVARAAGCSRPFLSLLENGQRCPSLLGLEKISAALGVPPAVFVLSRTGPHPKVMKRLSVESLELLKDDVIRSWHPECAHRAQPYWSSADLTQMVFSPYLRLAAQKPS